MSRYTTDPEYKAKRDLAHRRYTENNPRRTIYLREYSRNRARQDRALVIAHYGGQCECCGETEIAFLELHHPDNNGQEHAALYGLNPKGRQSLWQRIKRAGFPDDGFRVQILCGNCHNAITHWGKCPHKDMFNEDSSGLGT